jgi:hypothetical protein
VIKTNNTRDIWQALSTLMNKEILQDLKKNQSDFKDRIEAFNNNPSC